jgi:hypothetical protein
VWAVQGAEAKAGGKEAKAAEKPKTGAAGTLHTPMDAFIYEYDDNCEGGTHDHRHTRARVVRCDSDINRTRSAAHASTAHTRRVGAEGEEGAVRAASERGDQGRRQPGLAPHLRHVSPPAHLPTTSMSSPTRVVSCVSCAVCVSCGQYQARRAGLHSAGADVLVRPHGVRPRAWCALPQRLLCVFS